MANRQLPQLYAESLADAATWRGYWKDQGGYYEVSKLVRYRRGRGSA